MRRVRTIVVRPGLVPRVEHLDLEHQIATVVGHFTRPHSYSLWEALGVVCIVQEQQDGSAAPNITLPVNARTPQGQLVVEMIEGPVLFATFGPPDERGDFHVTDLTDQQVERLMRLLRAFHRDGEILDIGDAEVIYG